MFKRRKVLTKERKKVRFFFKSKMKTICIDLTEDFMKYNLLITKELEICINIWN